MKTGRLEIAYLEAGTGNTPIVLVHGNTSSSLFFQDFMLALAATTHYKLYAPDMRGFGDTQALPVDATRGLRDFSDDLNALALLLALVVRREQMARQTGRTSLAVGVARPTLILCSA